MKKDNSVLATSFFIDNKDFTAMKVMRAESRLWWTIDSFRHFAQFENFQKKFLPFEARLPTRAEWASLSEVELDCLRVGASEIYATNDEYSVSSIYTVERKAGGMRADMQRIMRDGLLQSLSLSVKYVIAPDLVIHSDRGDTSILAPMV